MIIEEGTDRLTSYGAETIEYDGMGNPKSYRGSELTWEKGRQLTKMSKADKTIQFGYDALGMRISREADGVRTEYIYEGDRLLRQIAGSEEMTFIYGSEGIIGFKLGTSKYLYRKNVLGDVEEIYDESGTLVGKYSYTAFGECEIETDVNGIATKNPIRYRGYYFDEETGFYYLKTRYYDPETGRFITIDDVSYLAPDTINGLNLYAYCGNNPVMNVDPNGQLFLTVLLITIGAFTLAGGIAGGVTAAKNGGNVWAGIGKGLLTGAAFGVGFGLSFGLTTLGGAIAMIGAAVVFSMALTNLENFIYYTYISDGVSDLTPSSYSGVNGDDSKYLSRWDRLDYAKAQTGEKWYNWNAWRYYSEYSLHMYGWLATSWAYDKNIPVFSWIASRSETAEVLSHNWDSRWYINLLTIIFGFFGM